MKLKWIAGISIFSILVLSSLTFTANEKKPPTGMLETESQKLSYVLGLQIGSDLKSMPAEIDLATFRRGIEDSFLGNPPLLTLEEVKGVKEEFSRKMRAERMREMGALAEKNQKEGEAFLEENGKNEGVITTESGLQYKVLREGDGPMPTATDRVSVHYRGTFLDGMEFDSSYARNEPATFQVRGVITGWTEALQLMRVGSKYRLFIPWNLAYGKLGSPPDIGPSATLIFDVELLSIEE